MRRVLRATSIVLMICIPQKAWSGTWYVDALVAEPGDGTAWETAFKAIQEGIEAAADDDTVIVAQAIYVENLQFQGKNVILRSTGPRDREVVDATIIDGNGAGSVVTFSGTEDETCALSGFTIRNGIALYGGGVRGGMGDIRTRATVRNNVITGNLADDDGGGLAYCSGLIENNIISGNSAQWWGGGLAYCDAAVKNNTIAGNAAQYGGGLYWCNGTIQGNTVTENLAGADGAGLAYCDGTIQNNKITGNSADDDGGGLAYCDGIVQNNAIAKNLAQWRGAGLYWCNATIQNNTIAGNSAESEGGGLHDCHGTIRNCIIWGNTSPRGAQLYESSEPTYSCIQDWTAAGALGNIDAFPYFMHSGKGDYHLRYPSPCIDAAANYHWFAWPQRDLDGDCRLYGDRIDMGCYEHNATPDSDGDLLSDADESAAATDPTIEDTDGDGLRDGLEVLRGSDPIIPTTPRIVHVPSDIPTIRRAILFAVRGEEIVLAPGTYRESVHFVGVDLTLRSRDPENPDAVASTVLDCGGVGSVVHFTGHETEECVISGFTIRNGRASNGGGICGGTDGHHTLATIQGNVIVSNSADDDGGGVAYCDGMIRNNTISGNSAQRWGGGLAYCDGVIQGNVITANTADDDGGGLAYCDATIHNNAIKGNRALGKHDEGEGGGLYACHGTIQYNAISGNRAVAETDEGEGGGLADCDGTIQYNTITHNSADDYGGGLCRCDGTVKNNAIAGNSADEGGGLGYCDAIIRSNTIVGNLASIGGGLAYCNGEINNSVIWGNRAPEEPQLSQSSEPTYSCIHEWAGGGDGNIAEDPQFADADGIDGNPETQDDNDYRLLPNSRCIDVGDNAAVGPGELDLDANLRIAFGRTSLTLDMGAYEFDSAPFAVNCLSMEDFGLLLIWNSQPNDSYTVWSRANMLDAQWVEEATITSEGALTWWTDTDTTPPYKFYRIELK
ncbi:right-handed parallel beta-helix repeat-containing protein [bacterium]|nr:right-handed parallel beta-helix repeat-containing protein [bacterium]